MKNGNIISGLSRWWQRRKEARFIARSARRIRNEIPDLEIKRRVFWLMMQRDDLTPDQRETVSQT